MAELIYKGDKDIYVCYPAIGLVKKNKKITVAGKEHIKRLKMLGFEEVKEPSKKKEGK